jgi:hypothetical protein
MSLEEGNQSVTPAVDEGMRAPISKRLRGPLLVVALLAAFAAIGGGIESARAQGSAPATTEPSPARSVSTISKHSRTGPQRRTTPKIVVSTPARCPTKLSSGLSHQVLNKTERVGLSKVLVPAGPSFMTICRYSGLNQKVPEGSLERSVVVSGTTLSGFVTYADLKTWQVVRPGTSFGCPMSEGLVDELLFVYPSGPEVTVNVDIDGCPLATNGPHTVWAESIGSRLTTWVGRDGI